MKNDRSKTPGPPPKICAMPFTQLALRENGEVIPCCLREDYVVGNAKDQTLSEIWNGEKMQRLRREFLSGNVVTCRTELARQGCSRWTEHLLPAIEKSARLSKPPIRLDLRLNGKCNLECVMCDEWKKPNGVYDLTGFWEEAARDIFPGLVEIEVLGGEPLVQKDTFRLIDEISAINPRCRWIFNTNGHWSFNAKMRAALDKIALERVAFSIDSLEPATFAKIRKLGRLERALETLEKTLEYRTEREAEGRGFDLAFIATLQIGNQHEIPRMLDYCLSRKLVFAVIFLKNPAPLSLLALSEDERADLILEYRKIFREILALGSSAIRTAGFEDLILSLLQSLSPERRLETLTMAPPGAFNSPAP